MSILSTKLAQLPRHGLADRSLQSVCSTTPLGLHLCLVHLTQACQSLPVLRALSQRQVRPQPHALSLSPHVTVVDLANFETWLQELQATPALDHSDERQLRLARDARLLSALRDCHTDHLHHIRRLEDTRALAIHTLNLPIIRHLSAAQGREVRVHADTVSDRQLLSTRDEGNHRDDEDEDSDIEPSEYPCSSSDESSHLSHMSVAASRSTGTRIVEEYADAVPGQKRGRGVIEVIELE